MQKIWLRYEKYKKFCIYMYETFEKTDIAIYIYIVPEDNLHYLLKYYFIIKIFF